MRILSPFFYLLISFFLTTPSLVAQMPQGQFKPQDLDAVLNSMTEEDFNNILNELSKLSPQELEELEKIGRQVLIDNGIDPDTGNPLGQKAPSPEAFTPVETANVAKPIESKTLITLQNPANVQLVIDTLLKEVAALRQKAHGNQQLARRLAQWAEPLSDLVFYLKVMNKKIHHERLATKEFQELFNEVESLSRQLATYQPHIVLGEKKIDNDDPYKILGVPYTATAQEITDQYTKLSADYNHKKISKRLTKEKASKKEIDRQVRAARLTASLLKDAYDQLNDPQTKKLLDDKRRAHPTDQLSAAAQHNLTKVLEAISNSVYQKKLLEELHNFLKAYEPEQLAQKEAFEQAHTQRKKEQGELAKLQPQLTTGKYDRTDYPQQLPQQPAQDRFYRGGSYPQEWSPTAPRTPPIVPLAPIKKDDDKKKETSASSGSSASGQPKTPEQKEEEKRDENIKRIMKEMEEREKKEKKAQEEKEKKALQDELTALKAEKAADKQKGENETQEPKKSTKRKNKPAADNTALSQVGSQLALLKKEMRQDHSRKLFKKMHFVGKPDERLSSDELRALNATFAVEKIINALEAVYDALPEDLSKERFIKTEWERIMQEYGSCVACLYTNVQEEEKKYTRIEKPEDVPQELKDILAKLQQLLATFNQVSDEILGKTITPKQQECQDFLPPTVTTAPV